MKNSDGGLKQDNDQLEEIDPSLLDEIAGCGGSEHPAPQIGGSTPLLPPESM